MGTLISSTHEISLKIACSLSKDFPGKNDFKLRHQRKIMHMDQLINSPTWNVPTLLSFILTHVVNLDDMYFYVTKGEIRGTALA